jgi:hypothetical protein
MVMDARRNEMNIRGDLAITSPMTNQVLSMSDVRAEELYPISAVSFSIWEETLEDWFLTSARAILNVSKSLSHIISMRDKYHIPLKEFILSGEHKWNFLLYTYPISRQTCLIFPSR